MLPPPSCRSYFINSATASHHFSSSHIISCVLPFPSATHGHSNRCAAFCAVHPSHTHCLSSLFPISHIHCLCGPLSVTIYTNPLTAVLDQLMCAGAFGYIGNPCFIPAGVAMFLLCILHPMPTQYYDASPRRAYYTALLHDAISAGLLSVLSIVPATDGHPVECQ